MASSGTGNWICADCGHRHERNDPPCRSCAGERFAKLEGGETDRIKDAADVRWICTACGTKSPRNNTKCKECGSFDYAQLAEGSSGTSADTSTTSADPSTSSASGSGFYIGVVLGVAGVILIPYFLIFIAIPESLASLRGTSLLSVMGKDARENPYMKGSFMIIRWFGNGVLLLTALVVIGLVLLGL